MIKSYFGLKKTPFDKSDLTLSEQQNIVFDTIGAHSKQGGLCVIAGEPGTGKTAIMGAIHNLSKNKSIEVPTMSRTMHSYTNIIKLLMEAFKIDSKHSVKVCEADILQEAFKIHSQGKTLITIIDDAHLLKMDVLRKLRLLFDAFPRNHNLVLIGQMELLQRIALGENADIKSRITYSVKLLKINPVQLEKMVLNELDKAGLPHSTFEEGAMELILRNSEGLLRQCRNLILSSLVQAVMEGKKQVNTNIVNSILIQPHWKSHDELLKI